MTNFDMKGLFILILIFAIDLSSDAQITCNPKVGDRFVPIKKGVNMRSEPNVNSKILFQSPDDHGMGNEGVKLVCVSDGYINDFVHVKVYFKTETIKQFGINPNLVFLWEGIKENYDITVSFMEFYNNLQDSSSRCNFYDTVKDDDWLREVDFEGTYDIVTCEDFWQFWIKGSDNEDAINYIIQNHERQAYVHKTLIERMGFDLIASGPDFDADYHIQKIEEFIELKKLNSCDFNPDVLFGHLEHLVDILMDENNHFEAIKRINEYQVYFTTDKEKLKVSSLLMQASYFDNNIRGALDQGLKIIQAYKANKIKNTNGNYFGDIDVSEAYGISISCLHTLERLQEALQLSNECLKNESLQYPQYIQFHAILLLTLGRDNEACIFLNSEYMKGNESAREMYLEHCN